MIYFSLCWMEIVLWIHRTSNYKWFFSGLLPHWWRKKEAIGLTMIKWFFSGFLPLIYSNIKNDLKGGFPWWSGHEQSACQSRGHGFNPLVWEDLSMLQATKPVHYNTEVHSAWSQCSTTEAPAMRSQDTTREPPPLQAKKPAHSNQDPAQQK